MSRPIWRVTWFLNIAGVAWQREASKTPICSARPPTCLAHGIGPNSTELQVRYEYRVARLLSHRDIVQRRRGRRNPHVAAPHRRFCELVERNGGVCSAKSTVLSVCTIQFAAVELSTVAGSEARETKTAGHPIDTQPIAEETSRWNDGATRSKALRRLPISRTSSPGAGMNHNSLPNPDEPEPYGVWLGV